MKNTNKKRLESDAVPEFNFERSLENKYAKRYREGATTMIKKSNGERIVVLDEDVSKVFQDSESVNHALRALINAMPKVRKSAKSR